MKETFEMLLKSLERDQKVLLRWAAENMLVIPPAVSVALDKEIAYYSEQQKKIQDILDRLEEK